MNFQKLKGGMIAGFAMTGLVASLGLGSGMIAAADVQDDDETGKAPTSTVTTAEHCVWYMIGAPTAITLEPASVDDEYTGEALDIDAELPDINVYSSGNLGGGADTESACSFYTPKSAPRLTWGVAQENEKFEATYQDVSDATTDDDNFDFDFALTFDFDDLDSANTCDDNFSVSDVTLSTTVISAVGLEIADRADVTSPVAENGGDRCITSVNASTTIPKIEKTPLSAGADYTWTGPNVTITGSTHTETAG